MKAKTTLKARYLCIVLGALVLSACLTAPENNPVETTAVAKATTALASSATSTPTNTEIATSTSTTTATLKPSKTPTVTEIPEGVLLQKALLENFSDPVWQALEFPDGREEDWRAFAEGQMDLSETGIEQLKGFLEQWKVYRPLLDVETIPKKLRPSLHIKVFVGEDGLEELVLYAIDQKSFEQNGREDLLLLAKDKKDRPVVLIAAPRINGLEQQVSRDGLFVEYIVDGRWILRADGRKLDEKSERQMEFKYLIDESGVDLNYVVNSTYPRYYLNIPSVDAAFYAAGNLTYSQLLLLESMLELYSQDDLKGLAPYIFASGEDVEYIISRSPHPFAAALARPLGGSPRQGIVVLFSKNLFANRYDTASSLAHEAAHIWQGKLPPCFTQDDEDRWLAREIGNGRIPDDFFTWTADDLVKGVRSGEIGAYHMSYWVLTWNIQYYYIQF